MEPRKIEDSSAFFHEELQFAGNWKISSRIKFVCIDVVQIYGQSYAAFGTNNGSVYLFERVGDELQHLTTLKEEEALVTKLKFTISGNHLACALRNGMLVIFTMKFIQHNFECVRTSQLHKGNIITGLAWKDDTTLYSGDDKGFVSVTFAPATKSLDLISVPSSPVQSLKSPIVQMDACRSLMCVSTEKASFLFDSETRTFRTIGSKSRQGKFGAAFAPEWDGQIKLFSARPGYRLWQTEGDNVVSVTHQYKEFASMDPPRIWGQPISLKVSNHRSGVFHHLFSVQPNILVCVDLNNNFCFIDRVAKLAKAWLPSPDDLLSFSTTPSGHMFFLLTDNRICTLSYMLLDTTINQLISSSWISEAVELMVLCRDNNLVTYNISEATLSRLIESAGAGDVQYETLINLRDTIRKDESSVSADAEVHYPEIIVTRANNGMDEVDLDDGSSEISERSNCSSLDWQDLEAKGASQSRKGSDLLSKMRTRFKATSERMRHELTSSEKAQNLVKIVMDTTTKIKSDAGQFIVDKVNLMPSVVPPEMETSRELFDHQISPRSSDIRRHHPLFASSYLNFVELEAVANICWERWSTRTDEPSDTDICRLRIRRSVGEFVFVMNRLMTLFHDSVSTQANDAYVNEDDQERGCIVKDAMTMTVGSELWKDFPLPTKLQDLCGRIAVLSIFLVFSLRTEHQCRHETNMTVEKSSQSTTFFNSPDSHETETPVDDVMLSSLEPIFTQLQIYGEYGFVEETFLDYTKVVKIDVGFWRHCLQQFPISRDAFSKHVSAITETLRDRCVKLDLYDWSSAEVFHVLETSMVTEPLIAFQMLLKLFKVQPHQALRFAVQNASHVTVRDTFNILLYQHQLQMFLDYALAMMEETLRVGDSRQFIDRLKESDDIFITIVVLCAIYENKQVPEQKCRFCQAIMFLPPVITETRNIISFLYKSCGSVRSLEVGEKWLLENGYLVQYCEALIAQEKLDEMIKLAFTIDRSDLVLMLERLTALHIRLIIDLMISAKAPSCLHCGAAKEISLATWSWPIVGQIISQSLAAPNAVQLLSDIDIPDIANLNILFQTFSLNSLNAVQTKKTQEDTSAGSAKSLLSQCYRAWGQTVSEITECYLCGRLIFDGERRELLEIMPCCHNAFHRECRPSADFCVICLK